MSFSAAKVEMEPVAGHEKHQGLWVGFWVGVCRFMGWFLQVYGLVSAGFWTDFCARFLACFSPVFLDNDAMFIAMRKSCLLADNLDSLVAANLYTICRWEKNLSQLHFKNSFYTSWETAGLQVNGYPGNLFKRYTTYDEAEGALLQFHEERYRLLQMQSVRSQQQSSHNGSTLGNGLEVQHRSSLITYFVVVFSLGFLCCIILAHLFDSD
ncbi:hypothetical protein RHMOL_Rhmol09G0011000 [Rhododendron molle]|uniref:Uncharacterized protein n=1 Tax=Rhododendron molle TaxID=49168 RepID=A0ACC0M8K4_RHOML|nr:hypothetical protein RHMOL_Rhmol09G0011000 [Rhododendron molle]